MESEDARAAGDEPGRSDGADLLWWCKLRCDLARWLTRRAAFDPEDVADEVLARLWSGPFRDTVGTDKGRALAFGMAAKVSADRRRKQEAENQHLLSELIGSPSRDDSPLLPEEQVFRDRRRVLARNLLAKFFRLLRPLLGKTDLGLLIQLKHGVTDTQKIADELRIKKRSVRRARRRLESKKAVAKALMNRKWVLPRDDEVFRWIARTSNLPQPPNPRTPEPPNPRTPEPPNPPDMATKRWAMALLLCAALLATMAMINSPPALPVAKGGVVVGTIVLVAPEAQCVCTPTIVDVINNTTANCHGQQGTAPQIVVTVPDKTGSTCTETQTGCDAIANHKCTATIKADFQWPANPCFITAGVAGPGIGTDQSPCQVSNSPNNMSGTWVLEAVCSPVDNYGVTETSFRVWAGGCAQQPPTATPSAEYKPMLKCNKCQKIADPE